jgi:hypothetical protein
MAPLTSDQARQYSQIEKILDDFSARYFNRASPWSLQACTRAIPSQEETKLYKEAIEKKRELIDSKSIEFSGDSGVFAPWQMVARQALKEQISLGKIAERQKPAAKKL